jgi:hypothetical protein
MKARTASILFTLSVLATNMETASADDLITSHIPRAPVQSSAIAAVGYSKRLHVLEIDSSTVQSTATWMCHPMFIAISWPPNQERASTTKTFGPNIAPCM